MKILQLNSVCGVGSTGRIAADLYNISIEHGYKSKVAFGRGQSNSVPAEDSVKIGGDFGVNLHALMTRITDRTGFYSSRATKTFINRIREFDPDIVHLHNIHGYYINIEILFNYLTLSNKPVVWTLHDCWAFTGHCAHFDYLGCEKWKSGCSNCTQKSLYPASLLMDNSAFNFKRKKELFSAVKNMVVVAPSNWLASLVKKSFLKERSVQIINNGVDLDVFKRTESGVREKYGLNNKYIILGVANIWGDRKGFEDFLELAEQLDDDYRIILTGISEKMRKRLPGNIVGISRTNNIRELAEIYSAADVFVNPTFEEVFGLVNIEALACGTPVITYNTGGSTECIDETCGIVVEKNNIVELKNAIMKVRELPHSQEACRMRAEQYDKNKKYAEYLALYQQVKDRI